MLQPFGSLVFSRKRKLTNASLGTRIVSVALIAYAAV